ncbi:hypothetical protein [Spiroplasma taiwanense]|uniref:DUF4430 domain-containing protein n=1 Tax=Spiroplasma taiwanense CT-1 TaxID=1276220 RepID=S5MAL4_9MOLU|nr:hypothetical protein [Spiroplasma taiwanense]AGR40798.1 hypothetical protein STAIW_v1c01120 [Spiroplasma taiwanense CT-1]
MKKYKIAVNILTIFLVFFIILSSIFIYKFFTFKNDVVNSENNSFLKVKVFNQDEIILEERKENVIGLSLLNVLKNDSRFVFSAQNFLKKILEIENANNFFWMIYSATHNSCKDEINFSSNVGAADLYLARENDFVFKFEKF